MKWLAVSLNRPGFETLRRLSGLGIIAFALVMFVSCQDSHVPLTDPVVENPQFAISDASHQVGGLLSNKYFHFLPPVVWPSSVHFNGDADMDLFPEIEICLVGNVQADGRCEPAAVVDRFSRNPGQGDGLIKVKPRLEMYLAWWDARDIIDRGDVNAEYRANIFVGDQILGFADIRVVRGLWSAIKTIYEQTQTIEGDDDFAAIPAGLSILPIPFRLEQGVLCDPENEQCVTETVTLSETETVVVELIDETTQEEIAELIIPGQTGRGGEQVTVTIEACPGMTDLPLDIPTFDDCFRVAVTGGSLEDLTEPASVCIYETDELDGLESLDPVQAQLVTLHEQDETTGEIISLPHSPACDDPIVVGGALPSNPLLRFAKRVGQGVVDLFGPAPLEANSAFVTHRGRGGSTDDIRSFFQFALPANMVYLDPADASRTLPTPTDATTAVKVVDLMNMPVAGATVHFTTTTGSLDQTSDVTGPDGIASVVWTTAGDGTATASGFGIAGPNANGPRVETVDPFAPLDEIFDLVDPSLEEPVELDTGELTFEVTELVYSCNLDLPDPVLEFTGTEDYIGSDGNPYTRYRLSVTNWSDYPDELFAPTSDFGSCGLNETPSRTWVDIRAGDGSYLYGFCALGSAAGLQGLWFARPQGTAPPASVYVQLNDRACEASYTSNTVDPRFIGGAGTAAIDGYMTSGEWDGATCVGFDANLPEGGTTPAKWCAMNDASNLYVAVQFARTLVDPGNSASVVFDNDNDGVAEDGDDVMLVNPALTPMFVDDYRTSSATDPHICENSSPASCGPRDTQDEGTNDGLAAFANDGTYTVYEMSHPLNSADNDHDFSLSAGDVIGAFVSIRMIGENPSFPDGYGDTDYPGFRLYIPIVITGVP